MLEAEALRDRLVQLTSWGAVLLLTSACTSADCASPAELLLNSWSLSGLATSDDCILLWASPGTVRRSQRATFRRVGYRVEPSTVGIAGKRA